MFRKIINLFKFFDKKSRYRLAYMQLLILISSIFEILSIFSIGPLVQVLSNPKIIYDNEQFISKIFNFFDFTSFETFLVFLVITIFCIIFISTIILTYTLYLLSMFSQKLGNILRSSLFKFYISQPWLYHSKSNSSEYIRNIFFEANRATVNIIIPVLLTNSRLLTGAMVILALTIYNPVTSIIETFKYGFFSQGTLNYFYLLYSILFTLVLLTFSLRVFARIEKNFIDTI